MSSNIHPHSRSLNSCLIFHHADPQIRLSSQYRISAGRVTPSRAECGLLSKAQKWIVWRDTNAEKARDFIGKWHWSGEHENKGTQGNCCAMWLTVSGFRVMPFAFWVVFDHSSCFGPCLVWLRVLPGTKCISQPRWIPVWGFLGGGRTHYGLVSPPSFWVLWSSPG